MQQPPRAPRALWLSSSGIPAAAAADLDPDVRRRSPRRCERSRAAGARWRRGTRRRGNPRRVLRIQHAAGRSFRGRSVRRRRLGPGRPTVHGQRGDLSQPERRQRRRNTLLLPPRSRGVRVPRRVARHGRLSRHVRRRLWTAGGVLCQRCGRRSGGSRGVHSRAAALALEHRGRHVAHLSVGRKRGRHPEERGPHRRAAERASREMPRRRCAHVRHGLLERHGHSVPVSGRCARSLCGHRHRLRRRMGRPRTPYARL